LVAGARRGPATADDVTVLGWVVVSADDSPLGSRNAVSLAGGGVTGAAARRLERTKLARADLWPSGPRYQHLRFVALSMR
jgi:hypothetical protein